MMVMGTSTAALRIQNSESIVLPYRNTRSDDNLVAYKMANESELEVCYSPSLLVEVSVSGGKGSSNSSPCLLLGATIEEIRRAIGPRGGSGRCRGVILMRVHHRIVKTLFLT